jgi:hypothetical protein
VAKRLQELGRGVPAEKLAQLIADLDNEAFAVRERSQAELERAGPAVAPALQMALQGKPPLEAQRRLAALLAKLEDPARSLRIARALALLERLGAPDARAAIDRLAKGDETDVTLQAQAAQRRLIKAGLGTQAKPPTKETARYLRMSKSGTSPECAFTIERDGRGWSIHSVTERGNTKMEVLSRYGNIFASKDHHLVEADVSLSVGKDKKTARVSVKEAASGGDKAIVVRDGQKPQEFDLPAGVIVTSAPDWTDTFLLCRRYDRDKGGKQEFPGLWIHPLQPAQRPTFKVELQGANKIGHLGKPLQLDRLLIELRPKNQYVAWVDSAGRMIKLASLPFKDGGYSLVLEGFEKSAAELRPE